MKGFIPIFCCCCHSIAVQHSIFSLFLSRWPICICSCSPCTMCFVQATSSCQKPEPEAGFEMQVSKEWNAFCWAHHAASCILLNNFYLNCSFACCCVLHAHWDVFRSLPFVKISSPKLVFKLEVSIEWNDFLLLLSVMPLHSTWSFYSLLFICICCSFSRGPNKLPLLFDSWFSHMHIFVREKRCTLRCVQVSATWQRLEPKAGVWIGGK